MASNDTRINERLAEILSFPARPQSQHPSPIELSFIFFSDANQGLDNRYKLIFDIADFADRHGFEAVWMPERHFHPFGGIYPNPAVLASALAVRTKHIRLRSGSVVLPLHHPAEVVESWAMVDHLSNGRVDLGFASGWNPNDFILSPGTFANLKEVWKERLGTVRRLWRGEPMSFPNGKGKDTEIRVYPQPIQKELNVWLAITKLDETYTYAGHEGYNVLTMLQGIDLDELGRKIRLYKTARQEAGLPPEGGKVTLMLHTLVHENLKRVEAAVREPFFNYIKSALTGHIQSLPESERPSERELNKIVEYSYERYFKTGAMFGSVDDVMSVVKKAASVGVTEIACLMDFGIDYSLVMESLPFLHRLKTALAREGLARMGGLE
ncbi:LLM class flavin-dependent oxidoreductase [Archangium violaceum]|uniref:MupA/Atu3671 family FMN-dependent luciferase-like monooxygenase n=1 Tax=Archangium violaceum TaxID=83451 RepID=UPI00194DB980|nr:MupA/Atu3671 family FMN-dependent luciferase-like monooxygenase [Archangium violaceum]QRN93162.1 LLM class flavin-dependent oxidoreductase [Archangium violaceum]UQK84962.1 luciferase family protein [Archangium gephyra]